MNLPLSGRSIIEFLRKHSFSFLVCSPLSEKRRKSGERGRGRESEGGRRNAEGTSPLLLLLPCVGSGKNQLRGEERGRGRRGRASSSSSRRTVLVCRPTVAAAFRTRPHTAPVHCLRPPSDRILLCREKRRICRELIED